MVCSTFYDLLHFAIHLPILLNIARYSSSSFAVLHAISLAFAVFTSSRVRLSGEEVLALLEEEQDDGCPDEVFCSGSDEELGFLEKEEDIHLSGLVMTVDIFGVSEYTQDALSYRDEEEEETPQPRTASVRCVCNCKEH